MVFWDNSERCVLQAGNETGKRIKTNIVRKTNLDRGETFLA